LSDQTQAQQISLEQPLDRGLSRLNDLKGCYEQSLIMISPGIRFICQPSIAASIRPCPLPFSWRRGSTACGRIMDENVHIVVSKENH